MLKEKIPIFFTIDDGYAPFCGVSIASMIKNASKDRKYIVHILYKDLSEKNKKRLMNLSNENFEIRLIYMKDEMKLITERDENKLRCDYFTLTIYFRLFIADLFEEYDKGIYIDSDTVVPGDISELYNIELGNNIIGAPTDFSIQEIPELINYMENAMGFEKQTYINSGILLLNLKVMRDKKFSNRFLELLNTYHFDTIAPDQDYINAICHGKIVYLGEEWDTMPNKAKPKNGHPKIIHYNLFDKPWCYDDIQYEEYFWKYAKDTEFYDDIVKFKENYSEKQKKADTKSLKRLLEKGNKLPDNEVTFKKIYESGGKIRL